MHFFDLTTFFSDSFRLLIGHVEIITADGSIRVRCDSTDELTDCDFLRMTSAPIPPIHVKDSVLFFLSDSHKRGYVLGVIEKSVASEPISRPQKLLEKGVEQISNLTVEAQERIEFRCGKSSISMDKKGRIVVKGTNLVNRASAVNKIKGAAVRIN